MNIEESDATSDSVPEGKYKKPKQIEPSQFTVLPDVSASTSDYQSEGSLRIESVDFKSTDSAKFHVNMEQENRRRDIARINARLRKTRRR